MADGRGERPFHCPSCAHLLNPPSALTDSLPGAAGEPEASEAPSVATADTLPPASESDRDDASSANCYPFLAAPRGGEEMGWLGGYRVLRVLGEGGMGVVFLAEDPNLQRHVALKVMRPAVSNPTGQKRFLREARAIAALQHDHVVPIYQVGEDNGVPFLVMPLLVGQSLDDHLERERRPPLAETLRIGREIAEALAAAHAKGMIHRDIKPSNVWLEAPNRRVKVLDFGLARGAAESTDKKLTGSGAVVGTPAYLAPEQADGHADPRSDLFSLGCVLYEMTTGKRAFQGATMMAILVAVASTTPRAPAALDATLPKALSDLIMALLAKRPEQRPPTAAAVVGQLAALSEATRDQAPTRSSTPAEPEEIAEALPVAETPAETAERLRGKSRRTAPERPDRPAQRNRTERLERDEDRRTRTKRSRRVGSRVWPVVAAVAICLPILMGCFSCYGFSFWMTSLRNRTVPTMSFPVAQPNIPAGQPNQPPVRPPVPALVGVALVGHGRAPVNAVAFSPDSKTLASGSEDSTVKLWDVITRKERATLSGHTGFVHAVAFSPDGKTLASGSGDGTVKLWEVQFRKEITTLKPTRGSSILCVAFRPDGATLAAGGTSGEITLWNVSDRTERTLPNEHTASVNALAFSPDGQLLASASDDRSVRLWDPRSGQSRTLFTEPTRPMMSVAFAPDSKERSSNRLYAHATLLLQPEPLAAAACSSYFLTVPEFLAGINADGTIRLWDLRNEKNSITLQTAKRESRSLAFSPDGKTIAAGLLAEIVRWDVPSRTERPPPLNTGRGKLIRALCFSADGKLLATGGGDVNGADLRLWDLSTENVKAPGR